MPRKPERKPLDEAEAIAIALEKAAKLIKESVESLRETSGDDHHVSLKSARDRYVPGLLALAHSLASDAAKQEFKNK